MKIKVSELTGDALDYLVAKANGWVNYPTDSIERGQVWHMDAKNAPYGPVTSREAFRPSTDWAQGGPIIERELLLVDYKGKGLWFSFDNKRGSVTGEGETPLEAAMRCYVASKLGDEVNVPDELAIASK